MRFQQYENDRSPAHVTSNKQIRVMFSRVLSPGIVNTTLSLTPHMRKRYPTLMFRVSPISSSCSFYLLCWSLTTCQPSSYKRGCLFFLFFFPPKAEIKKRREKNRFSIIIPCPNGEEKKKSMYACLPVRCVCSRRQKTKGISW